MSSKNNLRLPPQDIDAEKSVLGSILLDKNAIINIVDFLRAEHFYKTSHQNIFHSMVNLYEKREPIDVITLQNELNKDGKLEDSGGVSYLTELVYFVSSSANSLNHARLIQEASMRRNLISSAAKLTELAYEEDSVSAIIDKAEQNLFSIYKDTVKSDFKPLSHALDKSFERLDELNKNPGALRGVPTGLKQLDRMMSGLQKEALIILAARPSVGKTSLAINMAQYACINHGKSVAFFSLEMGDEEIVQRMLSAQANIENWKIKNGQLSDEEMHRYSTAMGELGDISFHIDDTPGISVLEMRTKIRRLIMKTPIDLIIVDYLQLCKSYVTESRVQQVSDISQGLKNLAREMKVPVVALSQLSRAVESRDDSRPQLSDLRDSGSIEQDADVVMFLSRPQKDNREDYVLSIAKHRAGATGDIQLMFKGDRTRFYEVTHQNPS
ncbi:MAG: replicative DNA helicase [Proteobacteria bacterium]|nr:replicative DNA helicase [Pseudomonadota bacterium]